MPDVAPSSSASPASAPSAAPAPTTPAPSAEAPVAQAETTPAEIVQPDALPDSAEQAPVSNANEFGLSPQEMAGIWRSVLAEQQAAPVQPAPVQPQAPKPAPEAAPVDMEFPTLDPEQYDQGLIKAFDYFKARDQKTQQLLQALIPVVQDYHKQQDERQGKQAQEFDGWVNGLGDAYAEIFGKGEIGALKADSPQAKARIELYRGVQKLMKMQPGLSPEKARQAAVNMLYPDKVNAAAVTKVKAEVQQRRGQFLGRPNSRPNPTPVVPQSRNERLEAARQAVEAEVRTKKMGD